jgi:glycosyltransferase involved in cell wall biosynthesis
MLSSLLASWSRLSFPEAIDPVFIVVENDEFAPNENIVAQARADFAGGQLIYAVEPDVGIPQARNAAIQVALDHGAGFVAFVDDDETVSPDWFVSLHQTYLQSGAQLIGGPVRADVVPQPAAGVYRRILQNGIRDRYRHVEQKAAVRQRREQLDRITILTNNWLAHADLFTKHGLRFDPDLRYSGGSDTKFFRDAVGKGIRTAWAPDAIVFETVPPERISLAYQFRRGREQSKTSIRAKIKQEGRVKVLPVLIISVALRIIGAGLLFVAIPLTGGRTLVRFTRSCGWIAGRIAGFFGRRSHLYRQITGG